MKLAIFFKHLTIETRNLRVPEMPQIPFAFECNQPNGNSVDFGKR